MNCHYCNKILPHHISSRNKKEDFFECKEWNVEYFFLNHSYHINMYAKPNLYIQFSMPPLITKVRIVLNGWEMIELPCLPNNINPKNIKERLKCYLIFSWIVYIVINYVNNSHHTLLDINASPVKQVSIFMIIKWIQ